MENDGSATKALMLMQFPVDDDETVPTAPPPELIKPDKLYVAVGKDVKRSESVLMWAIQNSGGKKICIIHVHQPPQMINILGKKHHVSSLPEEEVKASLEIERQIMLKTLDSYTTIAVNFGARAQSLHIERDSIEEGILELIFKHKIDKLVMGAAADENYHINMVEPTSKKAIYVQSHAPAFCSAWFICKGALICTRYAFVGVQEVVLCRDDGIQAKAHRGLEIPSALNARAERGLIDSHVKNLAQGGSYSRGFGGRSSSIGKDASLTSISRNEAAGYMELPTSSYYGERQLQLEPYGEREDTRSEWREARKHGQARLRGDNPRLGSLYVDSDRSQISEEDDLFLLYSQESERRKEAERSHALTKLKFTNELQSADDEKLSLLYQIQDYEQKLKDLEDNFASVVAKHESEKEELFKLSEERANAPDFFCVLSSDDIKEATNEYDASMQVWQGDDWTAFKGFIAHTEVIVKIFLDSLHGPIKYNREVEVLSKFRHPNLLTLIGACPDMNALVFEYIRNGSLGFNLSCPDGTPSLSWKIRIKIATELCSLLLFLHSRQPQWVVHGALTPSCVLLDSTFRCKVYDFWRSHLYATGDDSGQVTSPYIDPEIAVRGEITPASDVYSFGVIMLQLLTGKSDIQIRQAVTDALALQDLSAMLDSSAGEWPLVQAEQFAYLGLRCCDASSENRPDLDLEVWRVLKPMWDSCQGSFDSVGGEAPSCFICPISQEVMIDPHVAADGHTYEAEALKGWLDSGKMTSPMTNLPLDHQNLIPCHTLRSAIQEWKARH
ncbi:U-box domain-containing protein [Drosera capensis]